MESLDLVPDRETVERVEDAQTGGLVGKDDEEISETTVVRLLDDDDLGRRLGRTTADKQDTENRFDAICHQLGDALEHISSIIAPPRQHSVERPMLDQ